MVSRQPGTAIRPTMPFPSERIWILILAVAVAIAALFIGKMSLELFHWNG